MLRTKVLAFAAFIKLVSTTPLIYDGRAPLNYTAQDLDASMDPYYSGVKGTHNASYYTEFLGTSAAPTMLWQSMSQEQVIAISIDNTSIFTPGNSTPQNGFRRTELIAQTNMNHTALNAVADNGTTMFHLSVQVDTTKPLNYTHEYQIMWIEPNDGTHVFDVQLGTPYGNPYQAVTSNVSHSLKFRSHNFTVLFETPLVCDVWHNLACEVNWSNHTIGFYYSQNGDPLKNVTGVVNNTGVTTGAAGQGDYHFGVLKLPLTNTSQTAAQQADIVHFGIQEGCHEGLHFSGSLIESVTGGISVGGGATVPGLT